MTESTVNRAVDAATGWWRRVAATSPTFSGAPAVPITIRFGSSWRNHPRTNVDKIAELVAQIAGADLTALGIPARPDVEIDVEGPAGHDIEVAIDRRRCTHPASFVEHTVTRCTRQEIGDALARESTATSELMAWVVGEMLRLRPSQLLGDAQWERYASAFGAAASTDLDGARHGLVGPVLDDRLSIRDQSVIEGQLGEPFALGRERVIEAVRPADIEVLVPRVYLHELTTDLTDADLNVFASVRRSLFQELGALYPDFRFVVDDGLAARTFAFRLNHLATAPLAGLAPTERFLLSSDPSIKGERPYRTDVAVIGDAADGSVSPVGYVAACLGRELFRSAASFVHIAGVEQRLFDLELLSPTLVEEARSMRSSEELAACLRALVAEGLSIRRLRRILEWSLEAESCDVADADTVTTGGQLPLDPRSSGLSDEQVLFSYVRMSTYTSVVRAAGDREVTTEVLVLDPRFEDLVADRLASAQQDEVAEKLGAAVRAVAGDDPSRPLLVSTLSIRPTVRRLLARTMPTIEVIAKQEFPLGVVLREAGRVVPADP